MKNILNEYVYRQSWKKIAAKIFDIFCFLLLKPLLLIRRRESSGFRVSRILCMRLDHLGDVVMSQPALRVLREKFPEADVHLMVADDCYAAAKGLTDIDLVIPVSGHWFSRQTTVWSSIRCFFQLLQLIRGHHYDAAIDFRGDIRLIALMFLAAIPMRISYGITGGRHLLTVCKEYFPETHQVLMNLRLLDAETADASRSELVPFQSDSMKMERFKKRAAEEGVRFDQNILVVHPGAGYPSKRWKGESYAQLCKELLSLKIAQIVLIGTRSEIEFMPLWDSPAVKEKLIVDLRGKLILEELPYLFRSAQYYIGNDSGPAHLAACEKTKLIILFSGTNNPEFWRPWTKRLKMIRHSVSCSPCHAKTCLYEHHDCMNQITVKQVVEAVQGFFLEDGNRDGKTV